MPYTKPKGTNDMLPARARAWSRFLQTADMVFSAYGYEPITTPTFEKSEIFTRGCGEDSDVASKEIFSVFSKGALAALDEGRKLKADQKLALRPEGTASVVRAIVENNLVTQGSQPAKLYYAGPMFRCERPQKGRYREFWQVGVECLGATEQIADAEAIVMCMRFFEELGLPKDNMQLLINSMGCKECRPAYIEAIKKYMQSKKDALCDECVRRTSTNPLRVLDCKNPACAAVIKNAPKFSDFLCDECKRKFDELQRYLQAANLDYTIEPTLVRGFDYYTGAVFEVQMKEGLGSQSAIGGGGRYDGLSKELGGPDVSGLGFAVGFERIMIALESCGVETDLAFKPQVYVAAVNAEVKEQVFYILQTLRDNEISALSDTQGRSLKSQFKSAGKLGANFVIVVGPDELARGEVTVRNMLTHTEKLVKLCDIVKACS